MFLNDKIIIIGSGVAGLFTALKISDEYEVVILTKENTLEGSTYWAQGGIAAVLSKEDDFQKHIEDTLVAGNHLNSNEAVKLLVEEGSKTIKELIGDGFPADKSENGSIDLTLEGAHSVSRIIHAGGDGTGRILQEFLWSKIKKKKNIKVLENRLVFDSSIKKDRVVCSILNSKENVIEEVTGNYLVIATGGSGQVYQYTTNPPVSTGDGLFLAHILGLSVKDLEFYQFHPTALRVKNEVGLFSKDFLISESVRGEGGILKNNKGEEFVKKYDSRGDLAPRDVVARAIWQEMIETGEDKVFLDITGQKEKINLPERFPGIYGKCLEHGIDLTKEPVPISPSAHYQIGGIATDLNGRTSLDLVYATGEVASTGVHGANRLASNSLLEGLVFAAKVAGDINQKTKEMEPSSSPSLVQLVESTNYTETTSQEKEIVEKNIRKIKRIMWKNVGLIRTEKNLQENLVALEILENSNPDLLQKITKETIIFRNLLKTAQMITTSALERKDSVGAHYLES
jgi:L-aspartate oxidase